MNPSLCWFLHAVVITGMSEIRRNSRARSPKGQLKVCETRKKLKLKQIGTVQKSRGELEKTDHKQIARELINLPSSALHG